MWIGRNIAKLRRSKGLTQGELAEKAGISIHYLSRIEGGNCPSPHVKTLSRIAYALGIRISELYSCEGCKRHRFLSFVNVLPEAGFRK
ncbi:helix-turn-helix domain-containing protein [Desulfosporosinus fructosivorans]